MNNTPYVTRKNVTRTYASNGRGIMSAGSRFEYEADPIHTNWLIVGTALVMMAALVAGIVYMVLQSI